MPEPHPDRLSRGNDKIADKPADRHADRSAERHADRHEERHAASRGGRNRAKRVDKRTLFARMIEFLSPGPDSKDELISSLAEAEDRELIEPESRKMLEGVIRMADLTAAWRCSAPRPARSPTSFPTARCTATA